jgi:hypothetical protein
MKREKQRGAGAPGKAPLLGKRNADMSSLRCAMHEVRRILPTTVLEVANWKHYFAGPVWGSVGFQTRRIADPLIGRA